MNRNTIIATIFALVCLAGQNALAQSAHDVFQKGLVQERAQGDLNEAIRLYQQIVEDHKDDRALVAKALLQMGGCYEKLGKQEAQKAYQRLIKEFADQNDVATKARARLAALERDNGTSEVTVRKIWGARGTRQELQDENIALYWLTWGAGKPSPDGRYIAYTNWGPPSISVYDLSTGESRDITDEGTWDEPPTGDEYGVYPIWSPDGRYVAYAWWIDGTEAENLKDHGELRIVGLDGAEPRRVLYRTDSDEEWIKPYDWSPDGKSILAIIDHAKEEEGNWGVISSRHIVLISVEDGSKRILKSFEHDLHSADRLAFNAFFSPDGRTIAYDLQQSYPNPNRDIFLLKTDGSGESTPLATHPTDDQLLGWTPDGKRVLFATSRTGVNTMTLIEVHEGQSQGVLQIRHLEPGFQPMGLTRNGTYYYSRMNGDNDVYTATLDLEAGKVLVPPAPVSARMDRRNNDPCWSFDGKYLAYYAAPMPVPSPKGLQFGPGNIVIRSLETGQERELILSPKLSDKGLMPWYPGLSWAPDGRSLLINGWIETGHPGIFRVNIDTGKLNPLVLANPEPWSLNWQLWPDPDVVKGDVFWCGELSPDGNTLFYSRHLSDPEGPQGRRDIQGRLLARDLGTGQEREIYGTPDGAFGLLALSPDGQHMIIANPTTLLILPSAGGEPRELLKFEGGFSRDITAVTMAWTPDSRYLLTVKGKGGNFELWRIAAAGGRPERVADELPTDPGSWRCLRIHPDGQQIAFTSRTVQQELWVMENFLPDRASPLTLTGTDDPKRPFGLAFEVPDPEGDDVKEFAATVKLPGDDSDWNAPQWCGKIHPGDRGSLDGLWEFRWISDTPGAGSKRGIAQVKTVGDWVYILCGKGKDGLIKARRQGNRLVGGWFGVVSPGAKSRPWVGVIVNDERIDGAWTDGSARGRWDLRRNLLPSVKLTSPIKDNYVATGESVLLEADVVIAEDATARRVEFLIDGAPVGDDTDPPFQFHWDRAKQGSHWAAAKVYDSAGASERSLPVNVMVGGLKRVIARSEDDAEEVIKNGSMLLDTEHLALLGGDNMVVGLRFTDIRIPRGVRIKQAYVQFTVPTDLGYRSSEKADLVLCAELAVNAEPFAKVKHNITSRPTTVASVTWSPEPWTGRERSNSQRTPDLACLVQEVVNQPNWQGAGALVLIISGSGRRDVESWDKGGSGAPMLYVDY